MERSPWLTAARLGAAAWFVFAAAAWSVAHADASIPLRIRPLLSLLVLWALAFFGLRLRARSGPARLGELAAGACFLVAVFAGLLAGSPGILLLVAREALTVGLWLVLASALGALLLGERVAAARLQDLAVAAVTGLAAQMGLGLGLAAWGVLGQHSVLASLALVACTTLAVRRGRAFLTNALRQRHALPDGTLEQALLAALVTLLVAIHVDGLAPIPRGWDGLTQYLLVARTIAETGTLVPSQLGTGYELVLAQALVATGDMAFTISLCGAVPALLLLAVLHGTLRTHYGPRAALCGTLVLACVPLWTFQAADESKVDLMALATLAAAWQALDRPGAARASGALLGAAVAIKGTAVLGAAALVLAHALGMRAFRQSACLGLAAVVAFAPFAVHHATTAGSLAPRAILVGGTPVAPTRWDEVLASGQSLPERRGPPAAQLEMRRYAHELALGARDVLLWPWRATVQSHGVRSRHVDPGFLPLALLPLLVGLAGAWCTRGRFRAGTDGRLVVFTFTAWTLWALTCEQILWYGLPGFLAFAHAAARAAKGASGLGVGVASLLTLAITFVARAQDCGKPVLLAWAAGELSTAACEAQALPLAEPVRTRLRSDPDAKVLAAGTPYAWFVPDALARITPDPHQDLLGALARERDPSLLEARLRRLAVRYVLFDRNVPRSPRDPGQASERVATERTLAQVADLVAESRERGHAFYALR